MKKFTLDGVNYHYSKDTIIEEFEKELITEDGEKRLYLYLEVYNDSKLIYKSDDFKIYDDGYKTPYGLECYNQMKKNIHKDISKEDDYADR